MKKVKKKFFKLIVLRTLVPVDFHHLNNEVVFRNHLWWPIVLLSGEVLRRFLPVHLYQFDNERIPRRSLRHIHQVAFLIKILPGYKNLVPHTISSEILSVQLPKEVKVLILIYTSSVRREY